MSETVLVTGASGFLGAHCVARFAARGASVVAVWNSGANQIPTTPATGVRYVQCDLTDSDAVARLFEEPVHAVVHAAALLADGRPHYLRRAARTNVSVTADLVSNARAAKCARFVYCSSMSIFVSTPCPTDGWNEDALARPLHEYGWSKLAGEDCVRIATKEHSMIGVSLRLAGIHGPGRRGGALYAFVRAALADAPLSLTNAEMPLQLSFVADAADAVVAAATVSLPMGHHRINVASHTFPTLRILAQQVVAATKSASLISEAEAPGPGPQVMDTRRQYALLGLSEPHIGARLAEMIEWVRTLDAK